MRLQLLQPDKLQDLTFSVNLLTQIRCVRENERVLKFWNCQHFQYIPSTVRAGTLSVPICVYQGFGPAVEFYNQNVTCTSIIGMARQTQTTTQSTVDITGTLEVCL